MEKLVFSGTACLLLFCHVLSVCDFGENSATKVYQNLLTLHQCVKFTF